MPTSLAPVDAANIALSKIGAEAINQIVNPANRSSRAVNTSFNLAYLEVTRSARWNCLLTPAQLTQIPQIPIVPTNPPITGPAWAPNTTYLANTYLSFGGYWYLVMFTYTSTTNFLNDLTTGALSQTDQQTNSAFTDLQLDTFGCSGSQFPSGWAFQYALPDDFQLMGSLNGNICWDWDGSGSQSDLYELMALAPNGECLFCNEPIAVIQYVQSQPDTTRWDSLFTSAFTFLLASMIATTLKQDGGKLEAEMLGLYTRALSKARAKNGGESMPKRFNPVRSSRLVRSRFSWWGGGTGVAE